MRTEPRASNAMLSSMRTPTIGWCVIWRMKWPDWSSCSVRRAWETSWTVSFSLPQQAKTAATWRTFQAPSSLGAYHMLATSSSVFTVSMLSTIQICVHWKACTCALYKYKNAIWNGFLENDSPWCWILLWQINVNLLYYFLYIITEDMVTCWLIIDNTNGS